MLTINSNVAAMNAAANLSVTQKSLDSSLEKLSSGFRINKAADDAAGLSISEGLRSQIGGLTVATRNAQDGINVAQTADGALNETQAILQRMRDLSVQAANGGSQDTNAQKAANTEFGQLKTELDRIANTTSFGQQKLLNGSYNGTFQVGANATANDRINIDLSSSTLATALGNSLTGLTSSGLGLGSISLAGSTTVAGNVTGAQNAITALDKAITGVSNVRSTLGAYQNRFDHTINNLNVATQNLTASESQIRDTNIASETVNFTKSRILQQAGVAMLAQAKSAPQSVLQLLQ